MGRNYSLPSATRKFGKETYKYHMLAHGKREADSVAKLLRSKGYKARFVPFGVRGSPFGGYAVYYKS